jgi:type III pantothenate kinase
MLLAIDVGNTQTVVGLVDLDDPAWPGGAAVLEHWRVATDPARTADEWAVLLDGLLVRGPVDVDDELDGLAICSTVPSVLHEMREVAAHAYGDLPTVIVEPGVRSGIPLRVDHPREVGTDRIVNAVAAATLYGAPCVVVDMGTATTFDVVAADGAYVGGAIAPGVGVSLDALGDRGAQLRKVELARPRTVIARNTVEALQSGTLYGFVGQVDGIVGRMLAELGAQPGVVPVIATGGYAPVLLGESLVVQHFEPWLTLVGLGLVWQRNDPRSVP